MDKANLCGVVLAGGGSTRMGSDKSQLLLGEKTTLERITWTLNKITPTIVINQNEHRHHKYPVIADQFIGAGPLAGLQAVLCERKEDWFLLSACDTPFIQKEVYEHLLTYADRTTEAVIPCYGGRYQPLSGIFHRNVLVHVEDLLKKGERKVSRLFDEIDVRTVDRFEGLSEDLLESHFFNMNTKMEYEKALEILKNSERSRQAD